MSNAAAGTDKKDKASQNAAFKTAQQHGLANSKSSFFDLCWGDLQCQTLRPEPLKRDDFCRFRTYFGPHFAPGLSFETHLDF